MQGAHMCAHTGTAMDSHVCAHICIYVPVFMCGSYQVCVHVYAMWFVGLSTHLHINLSAIFL